MARPWFVFALPGSTCFVPAESEAQARRQMRASKYDNAPVDEWPCLGSLMATREGVVSGWWWAKKGGG